MKVAFLYWHRVISKNFTIFAYMYKLTSDIRKKENMNKKILFALGLLLLTTPQAFTQNNPLPAWTDSIFEPTVVGVPPCDAYIGLSLMEDGEIRHYNYGENKEHAEPYYLSSRDAGKRWSRVNIEYDLPYADQRSPISGEYIRPFSANGKVYVMRTEGGIEGDRVIREVDSTLAIMLKPPLFVDGGKRVIFSGHYIGGGGCHSYVSTDDGLTWQRSNVVNSPKHEIGGFHKGVRWNHGAVEPTIAELSDGRLWMIMRTSLDHHYQSFSYDGGVSWSEPTPSPFYGTITMPTFFKLKDGRLILFWTNTTPLPELEGATGRWDDVFTNRNATHVAISEDDGKSWIGCRELFLDERRNANDFGSTPGMDKSVHQAQAIQLSDNKILASIGQHHLHRKMVIFDVDWLYEKGRETHFADSLKSLSAFWYMRGIVGHCGYNRQEMPLLAAHPDKEGANVLNIRYIPQGERYVDDKQGAVWNFPAAKNGEVELSVKLPEGAKSVDLILNDRWFNPTDSVAKYESQYRVALNRKALKIKDDKWHKVRVEWSYNRDAALFVDDKKVMKLNLITQTTHGLSYLHLLGGDEQDEIGVYIESMKSTAK